MKNIFTKPSGFKSVMTFCFFIIALLFFWDTVFGEMARQISFQARITNKDKTVLSGSLSVTFRLYSAETDGTALWTETQTVTADSSGIISCYLGSVTPFPDSVDFNTTYYISLEVSGDGEMSPRIKVVPTPAALNSRLFDGLLSSQFLQAGVLTVSGYFAQDYTGIDHNAMTISYSPASGSYNAVDISYGSAGGTGVALQVTQNGTGNIMQLNYDGTPRMVVEMNGNVGIGTTSPSQALEVNGTVKATTFLGDGSSLSGLSGVISGLTTGKIPKAASTTSIADSVIYETSSNIGIGTTNPGSKLDVLGTLRLSGSTSGYVGLAPAAAAGAATYTLPSSSANGLLKNTDGALSWDTTNYLTSGTIASGITNYLAKYTGTSAIGASTMIYDDGSNIGIGTTNPLQKLQVGGDINIEGGSGLMINNTAASGQYLRGNGTRFVDASIAAGDLPTAIDAAKIADGSVSNGAFQYLSGVTSAVQTQLDSKAPKAGPIFSGTVTVGSMSSAGFVKNDAAGVLSGGNTLTPGTDFTTANLVNGTGINMGGTLTNRIVGSAGNVTVNVSSGVPTSVTSDTNVTGSIADNALTLGWSGQLPVSRGGTGAYTLTGILKGNGTDAFTAAVSGTDYLTPAGTLTGLVQSIVSGTSYITGGNLGIGTTAPSAKLEIKAAGTGPDGFALRVTDAEGTDKLALLDNGNLGIGTTAPGAALEIGGQIKITGGAPGENKVLISNALGLASWSSAASIIDANSLDYDKFKDAMTLDASTTVSFGNYDYIFDLTGTGNFRAQDNGSDVFTVKNTGNVGIGTTNPISKLAVTGKITVADDANANDSNGKIYIGKDSGGSTEGAPENGSQYIMWNDSFNAGGKTGWMYVSGGLSATSINIRNTNTLVFGDTNDTPQTVSYSPTGGVGGVGAFTFSKEIVTQASSPSYLTFSKANNNTLYSLEFNPDSSPQTLRLVKKVSGGSIIPLFEFDTAGSFGVFDESGNKSTIISQGRQWQQEFNNLIFNGSFESFSGGISEAPTGMGATQYQSSVIDGWFNLGGASISRIYAPSFGYAASGNVKFGYAAVNVSDVSSSAAQAIQQEIQPFALRDILGKQITLSVFARNGNTGSATTTIGFEAQDSAGNSITTNFIGLKNSLSILDSGFTLLSYTVTVPTNTSRLFVRLFGADASNVTNTGVVIYDGVSLVSGSLVSPFRPTPIVDSGTQTQKIYGDMEIDMSGPSGDMANYGVSSGGNLGIQGQLAVGGGIQVFGGSMTLGRGGANSGIWAYPMGNTSGTTAYKYVVTSVNSGTIESMPHQVYLSNGPSALTTSNSINIGWNVDSNASSYKLYGRSPSSLGLIASGLTSTYYNDNGSVSPNTGVQPPTFYQNAWTPPGSLTMEGGLRVGTGGNPSYVGSGSAVSFGNAYIVGNLEVGGTIYGDISGAVAGWNKVGTNVQLKNIGDNVGIGTTDPGAKLEVAGQIKMTGSTPGAGKVLTSDANGLASWQNATGNVASVFGRAGAVTAQANDYTWAQIDKTTSSLADITTRSAGDLSSGNLAIARMPTGGDWGLSSNLSISGGNVGIGTTSPSAKLEIRSDNNGGIGPTLILSNKTGGAFGTLGNAAQINFGLDISEALTEPNAAIQAILEDDSNAASGLRFFTFNGTASGERVRIANSGNVGIGTTAPGSKLHLHATAISGRESLMKATVSDAGTDAFYIGNITSADNWFVPAFAGMVNSTNARQSLTFAGFVTAANDASNTSPVVDFLAARSTSTTDPLNGTLTGIANRDLFAFRTLDGSGNSVYKMVMNSSGNVGIGTTSPAYKLDVNGTLNATNINQGGTGLIDGTGTTNYLPKWSDSNTLTGTSLVYDTGTNVGIGTTSPSANLQVSDGSLVNSALISTDKILLTYQNTAPGLSIISADNTTASNRAVFKGVRSRGTLVSPLAPSTDDDVLSFLGAIYDGTATQATAMVGFKVDGAVSSGVAPQRISFITSETTGAARQERLTIKANGNVGIGTTNPTATLHIATGGIRFPDNSYQTSATAGGSVTNIATTAPITGGTITNTGTIGLSYANGLKLSGNDLVPDYGSSANTVAQGNTAVNVNTTGNLSGGATGTAGGGLNVTLNTVNNPTFSTSVTTPILQNASSDLTLQTTTSGNILLSPSGNIGIGTTLPQAKLEIKAAGTSTGFALKVQDSTGADKLAFLDNGSLGIGTTSPGSYKLYVAGDAYLGGLTLSNGSINFGNDLDMQNHLLLNIGNAATDFTTGGGLNLAGNLAVNSTKLFVDATNGNVGIGTTSPTAALTFPAASTGIVLHNAADQTTNTETGFARWSGNSFQIGTNKTGTGTARSLEFFTGGVSRFTLTGAGDYSPTSDNTLFMGLSNKRFYTAYFSNSINIGTGTSPQVYLAASGNSWLTGGNVGIGTTGPIYKIDMLFSNNLAVGDGIRIVNSNTGNLAAAMIRVENNTGSDGRLFKLGSGYSAYKTIVGNDLGFYNYTSGNISILNDVATGKILFAAGAANTAQMLIDTNGNVGIGTTAPLGLLQVGTSPNAPLVVLASGNVGIGTTSPGAKLDIGTGTSADIIFGANTTYTTYNIISTNGVMTDAGFQGFGGGGSAEFYMQAPATGGLHFRTNGNSEKVTILSGGNVGIGTAAPLGLLQVGTSPNAPLVVLANGNVGVGTTSPAQTLDVTGTARITGNVGIGTTASSTYGLYVVGNAYLGGLTLANGGINFGNDLDMQNHMILNIGDAATDFTTGGGLNLVGNLAVNATKLFVDATNGNVGIGTSTPGTAALAIMNGNVGIGTTSPGSIFYVNGSSGAPSTLNSLMTLRDNNTNIGFQMGATTGYGWIRSADILSTAYSGIKVGNGYVSVMDGSTNDKVYVNTTTGNVGIGTTNPGAKFQISGTGVYDASGAARFDLLNTTYGTSWFTHVGDTGNWQVANGAATKLRISPTTNGNMDFFNGTGNVIVNGTGNVGIGTTSPVYKLDVNGTLNATAITQGGVGLIDGAGTANYLPKWSDSNTLTGTSLVYDNGTNVGIGTTSPVQALQVANDFAIDTVNHRVGLGLTNPAYQFTIGSNLSNEATRGITVLQGSDSASAANLNFRKSRGTFASPETVSNHDYLNLTTFYAYTNQWQSPAAFGTFVDGTVSSGVNPVSMLFSTGSANEAYNPFTNNSVRMYLKPDGSVGLGGSMGTMGSFAGSKMVIDTAGNVGIGTTNPTSLLYVAGDANITGTFNAGIFSPFTLSVPGAAYLAYSSGNVGIGTTNPGTKLTVSGSGFNGGYGTFISTDSGNGVLVQGVDGAGINDTAYYAFSDGNSAHNAFIGLVGTAGKGSGNVGDLRFAAGNNTERMRISTGGNVGIGTVSPAYRLNVADVAENTFGRDIVIRNGDETNYWRLSQGINTSGSASAGVPNSSSYLLWEQGGGYGQSGGLAVGTNNAYAGPLMLVSGGSEAVRVLNNGNVGIGTTSPNAPLSIVNAVGRRFILNDSATSYAMGLGINLGQAANSMGAFIGYGDGTAGSSNFEIVSADQAWPYTSYTTRFVVQRGGNVGIGTTGPGAKLEVAGTGVGSGWGTNLSTALVVDGGGLGTTAGSYVYPAEIQNTAGNRLRLQFAPYRRVAGASWQGSAYRMQYAVDNSFTDGGKAYIELGGDDSTSSGGGFVSLGTNGTDRLSILDNGAVGIGIITPYSSLHISNTNPSNAILTLGGGFAGTVDTGGQIVFRTDFGSTDTVGGASIRGLNQWGGESSGQAMDLAFYTNQRTGANAYTGLTERMKITQAGYVGIGTTAPQGRLDVSGITDAGSVYFRSTGRPFLDIKGGANSYSTLRFSDGSDGTYRWDINVNPGNDAQPNALGFWSTTLSAPALTILQSGYVGIGTTSPTSLLDVAGNLNVTGTFSMGAFSPSTLSVPGAAYLAYSSGNVGIGLTNPGAKLDIQTSVLTAPVLRVMNYGNTGNSNFTMTIHTDQPANVGGAYPQYTGAALKVTAFPNASADNAGYVLKVGSDDSSGSSFSPYLVVKAANGNVGIGTASPDAKLTINSNTVASPGILSSGTVSHIVGADAAVSRMLIDVFANTASVTLRKADGTAASPTALAANDLIGQFAFQGYGTTAYSTAAKAAMNGFASENWTDTAQGTYLTFNTTLNGAAGASERVRIDNAGNVGIGTTSPGYPLQVGNYAYLTNDGTNEFAILGAKTASGGLERLFLDANWVRIGTNYSSPDIEIKSGYVGIGTTSPGYLLELYNAANPIINLKTANYSTGFSQYEGSWYGVSNPTIIQPLAPATSHDVVITGVQNGPLSGIVIKSTGNVGIGTTSPQTSLEIGYKTQRYLMFSDSRLAHGVTNFVPTNVFGSFEQYTSDGLGGFIFRGVTGDVDRTALYFVGVSGNAAPTNAPIVFRGAKKSGAGYTDMANNEPVIQFQSGSTPLNIMTFMGSGNVGIGTTGPLQMLQVGQLSGSAVSDGQLVLAKSNGGPNRAFKIGLDSNYALSIGDYGYHAGIAYTPYLTMSYATGNVGIGTTDPQYKLDVNGTARISGVTLLSGGLSDLSTLTVTGNTNLATTSGNVGIGTTAPGTKLQVSGDGNANTYRGVIRIDDTGTSKWGGIAFPDSVGAADSAANNYYFIGRGDAIANRTFTIHIPTAANYGSGGQPIFGVYSTGSDQLFRVQASTGETYIKGSLGIGTTSPGFTLDVNGTVARVGPTGSGVAYTQYGNSATDANNYLVGDENGDFEFYQGKYGGTGNDRMRIKAGVNVGIGTASPSAKLHVKGDAYVGVPYLDSDTSDKTLTIATMTTGKPYLSFQQGGNSGSEIYHDNTYLNFGENSGGSRSGPYMVIKTAGAGQGSVGIGTTTPVAPLQVVGRATADYLDQGHSDLGTSASQSALSTWVAMASATVSYGTVEANTRIYKNGDLVAEKATAGAGTFNVVAGDIITTNNKPVGLVAEGAQYSIVPLTLSGTQFGFYSSRDDPQIVYVYAPYGTAYVEFYQDAYKGGTPAATATVAQGQIATLTGTATVAAHYNRVYASSPVIMTKAGTGGDYDIVSPASHELITARGFSSYSGMTAATTMTLSSSGLYLHSDNGLVFGNAIGDGAGGDTDMALPWKAAGDTYIIPHAVSDFGLISLEPTTVRVYYLSSGVWTLYNSYDLTSASRTTPAYITVGTQSGADAYIIASGPVLVVGDRPFYIRLNDTADDEYAALGYMSGSRSLFGGVDDWNATGANMYYNGTGNVGIGTTNPQYKLDVNGTARISGVTLLSGGLSDLSTLTVTGNTYLATTSGSVGIGTASPGGKLEVQGGRSFFSASNEQYGVGVKYSSSGGAVYFGATSSSGTPDAAISNAGGGTLMTLQNGGNVGIGTATPLQSLSLGIFASPSGALLGYANSDQAGLSYYSAQNFPTAGQYDRVLDINAGGGNAGSHINFLTQPVNGSSVIRMSIDDTGNVGIGTTAPGAKLDIESTTADNQIYVGSVAPSIRLSNNAVLASRTNEGVIALTTTANQYIPGSVVGDLNIYSAAPNSGTVGGILFGTGASQVARMYIKSDGNVGIGTTGPIFTLQTAGAANAGDGTFILNGGAQSTTFFDAYVDGTSAYQHTPGMMVRKDSSGTRIDQAPAALTLFNNNGTNNTWVKLVLANREASGTGNPVSIAGIAAQKTSGAAAAWASGDLVLWAKNVGSQVEVLRATSGGNVGMGTTAPGAKLEINLGGIDLLPGGNPATANMVRFFGGQSGTIWGQQWDMNIAGINVNNSRLTFAGGNNSGSLPQANILTLVNNGNVGIGTTAPNDPLHIYKSSGNAYLRTEANNGAGSVRAYTFGPNTTDWNLHVRDATGNYDIITALWSNGNVGIGTTNPGAKLEVNGTITATSFSGTSSNVSPYYYVTAGNGYGIGYWSAAPSTYGTFMSNSATYQYGDVNDYYIANVMSSGTGRGFTWSYETTPSMALNASSGNLAIKGIFKANGTGNNYFAGNVGIGTAAPGQKLTIYDTAVAGVALRLGYSDTAYFDFARNYSTGTLSIQGNQTGTNNIVLAPTSGNVGMGIAAPLTGAKLDVSNLPAAWTALANTYGATAFTYPYSSDETTAADYAAFLGRVGWYGGANGNTSVYAFKADVGNGSASWGHPKAMYSFYGKLNTNVVTQAYQKYYGLYLDSVTKDATTSLAENWGIYQADTTAKSYFAGNIGIGTTAPEAKLDIHAGDSGADVENIRFSRGDPWRYNSIHSCSWTGGNAFISFLVHDGVGDTTQATVMTLKGNGYVGIGTTGPGYKLDVYQDSDVWHASFGGSTGRVKIGGQTTGNRGVIQATTDLLLQRDGGNVGIGTASPTQKLQVHGNVYIDTYGQIKMLTGNAWGRFIGQYAQTGANDALFISDNYDRVAGTIDHTSLGTAEIELRGANAGPGAIYLRSGAVNTAPTDTLTVTGGNVGIGTAAPRTSLDILTSGTANVNGDVPHGLVLQGPSYGLGTYTGQLVVQSNDAQAANMGGSIALGGRYVDSNSTGAYFAGIQGAKENSTSGNLAGYLAFRTRTTGNADTEKMRIDSAGNIGIGMAAPVEPLQVHLATGKNVGFFNSTLPAVGSFNDNFSSWGDLQVGLNLYSMASGNVGIGTTAPGAKLEIVGTNSLISNNSGNITITPNTNLKVTTQYYSAKYSCTTTLSWDNGNVQYIQLAGGGNTFTFANPQGGGRYLLILKQPSSGSAGTVTWPAAVLWSAGTAPTLTATNSKVDIITFVYDDTNSKYYGGSSLNY
ncbi:MAG: hypothetical protein NTU54_06430 [Candidatus Omnitrophica bacterium]|nr:hypothetical protein [Candidatus Omnitrophota bacterium]